MARPETVKLIDAVKAFVTMLDGDRCFETIQDTQALHSIQSTLSNFFDSIAIHCKLQTYVTDATSMIKYHNIISYVCNVYLSHTSSLKPKTCLQRISHLQPYQHQPPLQCPWSQHQQKLPKGHQCQWLAAMPPHQVDPHKMWTDVVSGDVSFLSYWLILKICWPTKSKHANPPKRGV